MATKVFMEALSPTMEEGRLVKWMKNEGDAVASGDVLAEVETDKAIMELVARGEGVLRKRLLAEGATSPVGTLIGVIAAADENIDALVAGAPAPTPAAPAPGPAPAVSETAPAAPAAPAAGAAPTTSGGPPPRTESTPQPAPARDRSAAPPAETPGPGGRIIKRDIEVAAAQPSLGSRAEAPAPPPTSRLQPPASPSRDVPLSQIRKTIARRLSESIGPIPTFYLTADFDMERVAEMRTAMAEMGDQYKVSFNDIVLKAVAETLSQHPECNAHWLGDRIRYFDVVHLGMAVAIEEGLITPVIFDADRKRLGDIAREAKELAQRARDRRLKPDEYTGSTFSVSNLGMFGIDHFTAIINPPEAGILAIGGIEPRQMVKDGQVTIRRRMKVTMSCDHRVIDGATGAKFLQTLRRLIENPLMLVY
jgi:pyruvate dehydrogenase E2 component (dihydrolipoamide acetyltransferase)